MTDSKPAVAGASEAADILGSSVSRVSRWRDGDRMPRLAADLASTPVWHVADVEYMRDHMEDPAATYPFGGPLDLVGIAEAADILETSKRQISRWRGTEAFPDPCLDRRSDSEPDGLTAGPVWWRRDILAFKRDRAQAKRRRADAAKTAAAK